MDQFVKAHFQAAGNPKTTIDLYYMASSLFFNRLSMSKPLAAGRLRIVLDWARLKADWAAYFIRDGMYHISYRKMKVYGDLAAPDRDDRDGMASETIRLKEFIQKAPIVVCS